MSASTCECGHPSEAHTLVKGFECSPGVTINGCSTVPDVWVCSGGPEVTEPESASPWDFVCGCVLHDDPNECREKKEPRDA